MPLVDLKTDLKSLRFGNDRIGGGSSGQPYITNPIPEGTSTLGILDNDFLLRGGITAVSNSGKDILRLGKMFTSLKSPSGILFTAKQQLLSRTANRTQTSGILNEGIYTPLSTLAQAGVNAFGGHLNKQGINPFALTGPTSNNENLYGVKVKSSQPKEENRLVSLYQNITDKTSQSNWNFSGIDLNVGSNILSYGGGPGSILGIGKTNIRFADQRTGTNNPFAVSNPTFFYGNASGSHQPQGTNYLDQIIKGGATVDYIKRTGSYNPSLLDGLVNEEGQIIRGGQNETGDKNALASTNPTYFYTGSVQTQGANYLDQIIKSGATEAYIKREGKNDPNLVEGLVNEEGQIIRGGQNETGDKNALASTDPTYFYTGSIPQRDLPEYNPGEDGNLLDFKKFAQDKNNSGKSYNGVKRKEEYSTLSSPPTIIASSNLLNSSGENIDPSTLSTEQLNNAISQSTVQTGYNGGIKQDFREQLRKDLSKSQILSKGPSYLPGDSQTIDGPGGSRINYNNPTNPLRNLISYTSGSGQGAVDKINAFPVYTSSSADTTGVVNDLVKFRIAVINNNEPDLKSFIHFRAYLNEISDNYTATWNPVKYLGRGEEFYTYGGFGRTVSLGWTVAAQSKDELIPMYKKLNYLASSLAPDYSPNGYMKGNLVQLTIGGYFYEQPGIITGMSLSISEDSPFEIGINDNGGFDSSVKELPMIIRVNGFNFTPIHNFRPEIQSISGNISPNPVDNNTYGPQRYIALSNGAGNNYDS